MRLELPETASTDTAERLLSPEVLPREAGERLEAARAADQRWREARTETLRRRITWADTVCNRLMFSSVAYHILFGLHQAGRMLGLNAAIAARLKGTGWEWCTGIYEAVLVLYCLAVLPLICGVLLFRSGLLRWANRQCIEIEEAKDGTDGAGVST